MFKGKNVIIYGNVVDIKSDSFFGKRYALVSKNSFIWIKTENVLPKINDFIIVYGKVSRFFLIGSIYLEEKLKIRIPLSFLKSKQNKEVVKFDF